MVEVLILTTIVQVSVSQGFSVRLAFSSSAHLINLESEKFARIKLVSEGRFPETQDQSSRTEILT